MPTLSFKCSTVDLHDDEQSKHLLSKATSTLRSILPVEILDRVFRILTRIELLPCLAVNSLFYSISSRILYHTIDDLHPSRAVACLLQLSRNPQVQPLVRSLDLDWNEHTSPTSNLYRLLHNVLKNLTSLISLSLEFPRHHSPIWILRNCTFALKFFSTSMPCKQELADFLNTQPSITELTLRGFNHEDHFIPPFLINTSPQTRFSLLPTSLANLTSIRTVHGGPSIIAAVVRGRPVQMASVALFPSLAQESLRALGLSTAPMKRLSIMSFDPLASDYLLSEIADRFPHLEALHIVILLSEYTTVCFSGFALTSIDKFCCCLFIGTAEGVWTTAYSVQRVTGT